MTHLVAGFVRSPPPGVMYDLSEAPPIVDVVPDTTDSRGLTVIN